ncbi:uncharacterized protein LOC134813116 [Bolinopsis microptera]|uniref:uncharacterized protein LOC134813116 n=1 Tax=Bolinopsis microptera TaxID=2820187 RepID=UPI00307ACC82
MRGEQFDLQSKKLLYNLLFLSSLINQGTCLGQVEAVFQTLSTSDSKLSGGFTCRDGTCQIKMKVIFRKPNVNSYKTDKFDLQGAQTLPQTGAGALNDSPGTEFDNPINVTAPSQDKVTQFSVEIQLDDYSNSRRINMATLELTENVTTGVIYNRTLMEGSVNLTLSFKVICEENYYFDCSVFCVEQDDNLGHFTCDPVTGDPVCLEGWTGDDCLTRTCTANPDITGGKVTSTPQAIYQENDTIEIECDEDYQLNPHLQSNVLTCEADGNWSFVDFAKICTKSGCGGCSRLREPKHGKLTYLSVNHCLNANINSTVSVACYPHYTSLVRYQGLKCGQDKEWVNSAGQRVEKKGGKLLIDCIPTGDSDINVSEDALKKRLARSTMIIAAMTLFSFFGIIFLYCFLYRKREEKRKVSPRRKSYVPEDAIRQMRTLTSTAIGNVQSTQNFPVVKNNNGLIPTAAYVNHGFTGNGFDYEF